MLDQHVLCDVVAHIVIETFQERMFQCWFNTFFVTSWLIS